MKRARETNVAATEGQVALENRDVLFMIFSFLDLASILKAMRVNHAWKRAASSEPVWLEMHRKHGRREKRGEDSFLLSSSRMARVAAPPDACGPETHGGTPFVGFEHEQRVEFVPGDEGDSETFSALALKAAVRGS